MNDFRRKWLEPIILYSFDKRHNAFATYLGRDSAAVMSCESNFHPVVNIEPLWMVVHFFGKQGRARHERPCLVEINKLEGFLDGISSRHLWWNDAEQKLRKIVCEYIYIYISAFSSSNHAYQKSSNLKQTSVLLHFPTQRVTHAKAVRLIPWLRPATTQWIALWDRDAERIWRQNRKRDCYVDSWLGNGLQEERYKFHKTPDSVSNAIPVHVSFWDDWNRLSSGIVLLWAHMKIRWNVLTSQSRTTFHEEHG